MKTLNDCVSDCIYVNIPLITERVGGHYLLLNILTNCSIIVLYQSLYLKMRKPGSNFGLFTVLPSKYQFEKCIKRFVTIAYATLKIYFKKQTVQWGWQRAPFNLFFLREN